MYLQIKQLRIDVPAGTIQPTHQLLVRDAHSAAESVLLSSACTAVYGVMSHVHISNTPSTTNVIVELDRLLQASKQVLYLCSHGSGEHFEGHCGACRRKWRLSDTDLCPCGEIQTMSHIVESCPLTKLNGGLSRLHSADEDAVS